MPRAPQGPVSPQTALTFVSENLFTVSANGQEYSITETILDANKSVVIHAKTNRGSKELTLTLMPPDTLAKNADWGGSYILRSNSATEDGTLSLSFTAEAIEKDEALTLYVMKTLMPTEPPPAEAICWSVHK